MIHSLTGILEKIATLSLKEMAVGKMINVGLNMAKQRSLVSERKATTRPAILETMKMAIGDLSPVHDKQQAKLKKDIGDVFLNAPIVKAKMHEQGMEIGPKK